LVLQPAISATTGLLPKEIAMTKWRQYLGALLLGISGSSFALVPADIPGVPKDLRVGPPKAVVEANQRVARVRALAVVVITPNQFLDWAELAYPSLFPKGPASQDITYLGVHYIAARVYPNGNALGVTSANMVRGLGPFTGNQLVDIAPLADFTCQVASCTGGASNPGSYRVDPTLHTFSPNYNNSGKATWLGSTDGKSYDVLPVTSRPFAGIPTVPVGARIRGPRCLHKLTAASASLAPAVAIAVCRRLSPRTARSCGRISRPRATSSSVMRCPSWRLA
jgi:hypothetical protein